MAGQFDSNVRELEGALNDISLMAKVKKINDITVDIAAEAIRARKQDVSKMIVIQLIKSKQKLETSMVLVSRK